MKTRSGQRWITVTKEGPLHGRHILIDGSGNIVGGKVPKAFHGKPLGKVSETKATPEHYHEKFSHGELQDLHDEFSQHRKDLANDVKEGIRSTAKNLRDTEDSAAKEHSLVRRIRAKGGIKINAGHAMHTEYTQSVHQGVRSAIGNQKNGIPLDEMADELGMNARDLIDKLSDATPSERKKVADYVGEASKHLGDDHQKKIRSIKELDQHIGAIKQAMTEHKNLWSKFAENAEKLVPGAKAAYRKNGNAGLLSHLHHSNEALYSGVKKDAKRKLDDSINLSPAQRAMAQLTADHRPAPKPKQSNATPQAQPPASKPKNKLDELHEDVKAYMSGKMDSDGFLRKHDGTISRLAKGAAERRKGSHEDMAQDARMSAYKTLEALKNGTQNPKEGQNLGEHLLRRIAQGLGESARQGNERKLSRDGQRLAAIINQHRNDMVNAGGKEPTEDELFSKVSGDQNFHAAKYSASGTKKQLTDPRQKFDEIREAMKHQRSDATLDATGKDNGGEGNMSRGASIADPKGSAEDQAINMENEREMKARRGQLHDALQQFGLSPSERFAVAHRFAVGHADQTGGVLDWEAVSKHMSKDLGKNVSPDTAKKHFQNGRAKLHNHIGDERMGMLMAKSLGSDIGVKWLLKELYHLGLYSILKSYGLEDADCLRPVPVRAMHANNAFDVEKSLNVNEYIERSVVLADGSVYAQIVRYEIVL